MYARIVKLYALANPVRSGTKNDDFLFVRNLGFVFRSESRVVVRGLCLELCSASVHEFVYAVDAE
jgi:hypothetical protein